MYQKIKNIISLKFLFKRNKSYEPNPKRDWAILVSLFFLVNLILLLILVINYFKIANEKGSGELSNFEKINSLDLKSVELVLEDVRQKEAKYESLLENAPNTPDPSI